MTDGPLVAYRNLLARGELTPDPRQAEAIDKLQALHERLAGFSAPRKPDWQQRLPFRRRKSPVPGLYLYGGVGRGKSMLMDLFFSTSTVERRKRVHFHAFMLDVHARIHRWRAEAKEFHFRQGADPIPPLADAIMNEAWLLCFDEFEVTDIADAMIMARLFAALWERRVVVVATSNRRPDDLYLDGLQRDRFLPFIALLKERLEVMELDSGRDYRREKLAHTPVYFQPLDAEADAGLDAAVGALTGHATQAPSEISVDGRTLPIPLAGAGMARFAFDDLCGRPLGAADYLALARAFDIVVVTGIPQMNSDKRNEAKRFATLVDVLYDHRIKLIATAAAPPDSLYPEGTYAFEFRRTASRLTEMQSESYLAAEPLR
ncbi:MAG: cell division protein ZapE [Rhodospirillaceae bacterium]|nr:cell division protein ZapE [Rhodospirillaceae bacterium]